MDDIWSCVYVRTYSHHTEADGERAAVSGEGEHSGGGERGAGFKHETGIIWFLTKERTGKRELPFIPHLKSDSDSLSSTV